MAMLGEARNEGAEGMNAVGHAINNRSMATGYSPSDTIRQYKQYSFNDDQNFAVVEQMALANDPLYQEAIRLANEILSGTSIDPTGGAIYYHANYVTPNWMGDYVPTATIGAHQFYGGELAAKHATAIANSTKYPREPEYVIPESSLAMQLQMAAEAFPNQLVPEDQLAATFGPSAPTALTGIVPTPEIPIASTEELLATLDGQVPSPEMTVAQGGTAPIPQARPEPLVFSNNPIPGTSRYSSLYGAREAPTPGASTQHMGVDIAGLTPGDIQGRDLLAPAAGTVTFAGEMGGYGNTIEIQHENGFSTRYGHLASITVGVGDAVPAGATIGAVGSTGRSTGPHLHFEVMYGGQKIDPMPYLEAIGITNNAPAPPAAQPAPPTGTVPGGLAIPPELAASIPTPALGGMAAPAAPAAQAPAPIAAVPSPLDVAPMQPSFSGSIPASAVPADAGVPYSAAQPTGPETQVAAIGPLDDIISAPTPETLDPYLGEDVYDPGLSTVESMPSDAEAARMLGGAEIPSPEMQTTQPARLNPTVFSHPTGPAGEFSTTAAPALTGGSFSTVPTPASFGLPEAQAASLTTEPLSSLPTPTTAAGLPDTAGTLTQPTAPAPAPAPGFDVTTPSSLPVPSGTPSATVPTPQQVTAQPQTSAPMPVLDQPTPGSTLIGPVPETTPAPASSTTPKAQPRGLLSPPSPQDLLWGAAGGLVAGPIGAAAAIAAPRIVGSFQNAGKMPTIGFPTFGLGAVPSPTGITATGIKREPVTVSKTATPGVYQNSLGQTINLGSPDYSIAGTAEAMQIAGMESLAESGQHEISKEAQEAMASGQGGLF